MSGGNGALAVLHADGDNNQGQEFVSTLQTVKVAIVKFSPACKMRTVNQPLGNPSHLMCHCLVLGAHGVSGVLVVLPVVWACTQGPEYVIVIFSLEKAALAQTVRQNTV